MRYRPDLPDGPTLLEVNTLVWLKEQQQHLDSLGLDELRALTRNRDWLWLMGVWERSSASRAIALAHPGLQQEFKYALPDYTPADVVGSAYAVRSYTVDPALGTPTGLGNLRGLLGELGVGLVLDFIPNHCAVDHPWTTLHPEWFIQADEAAHQQWPEKYFRVGKKVLAYGKDPYFAPWTDTAQFDYANPQLRSAIIDELLAVASQCDAVRCDMAMLLLREIFRRTWQRDPMVEFWSEAIATVKARYPKFRFIAEVYWGLEWTLMELGFDYCYDKTLYDRLRQRDAQGVAAHLRADIHFSNRVVRFVENHDEPRALRVFGENWWGATLLCATVPGAYLEHLNQGERTARNPVQLARAQAEPPSLDAHLYLEWLAGFRSTLSSEFEVYPCMHPQVVGYRRGEYEFFINLSGHSVDLPTHSGSRTLAAFGALILHPSHTQTASPLLAAPVNQPHWLMVLPVA